MSVAPIAEFRTRRRVEFADTDLAGLVHFARFFVFMETAEHELLRSLGGEVHRRWEGHEIGWPRVAASCSYERAARFADVLEITVRVVRKGRSSMSYRFVFERAGERIATGEMTSVCCRIGLPEGPRSIPIPPDIAERLVEYSGDDAATD